MGCHAQSDFWSSAARYEPREESGVDTSGRPYGSSPLECLLVANADCDLRSGSLHNLSNSETLRLVAMKTLLKRRASGPSRVTSIRFFAGRRLLPGRG